MGGRVSCSAPHTLEAYHTEQVPPLDGDGYDWERLGYLADGLCLYAFAPYVGEGYPDSAFHYHPVVPSEAAWRDGAPDVRCIAFHPEPEAEPLRRSLHGSRE